MTNTKRQSLEQKLRDALADAMSALKEAGDPLHGLGPSQPYADAFTRYGDALKTLVVFKCPMHVAAWTWDGYAGTFTFRWEFSAALAQPRADYEHDTRFVEASCATHLDPQKPLDEELARLREEAGHYQELRNEMLRWATARRKTARAT